MHTPGGSPCRFFEMVERGKRMETLQRMLNEMFGQVQRNFNAEESARAKADPQAHKLTRVFEGRTNYRYYDGGKDSRGRKVWFCYSTGRNVAGYFLTWRQVETPAKLKARKPGDLVSTTTRDQWSASRSKKTVKERAAARCKAYKARRAAAKGPAIAATR